MICQLCVYTEAPGVTPPLQRHISIIAGQRTHKRMFVMAAHFIVIHPMPVCFPLYPSVIQLYISQPWALAIMGHVHFWRPHPGFIVIAEGTNESLGCSNGKQASICIVPYQLNFLKKIKNVILRRQECVNIVIFIVPNSTHCIVTAVVHGIGYPSQGGAVCCDL